MNYFEMINHENTLAWCGIGLSIITAVIMICTHRGTINKDRKLKTIERYTDIAINKPDINSSDAYDFLLKMELLCTGINLKIYDYKTLRLMAGRFLIKRYSDKTVQDIVNSDCEKNKNAWKESKKVIKKFKQYYELKECLVEKPCSFIKRSIKHEETEEQS